MCVLEESIEKWQIKNFKVSYLDDTRVLSWEKARIMENKGLYGKLFRLHKRTLLGET